MILVVRAIDGLISIGRGMISCGSKKGGQTQRQKVDEMEVSTNGATPRWMFYFMENPVKIGMRTGGTPMTLDTSK